MITFIKHFPDNKLFFAPILKIINLILDNFNNTFKELHNKIIDGIKTITINLINF
jgi:hypothetical protein